MPVLDKPNGGGSSVLRRLPAEIFIAQVGSGILWNTLLSQWGMEKFPQAKCHNVYAEATCQQELFLQMYSVVFKMKPKHPFSWTLSINYSSLNGLIVFSITVSCLLETNLQKLSVPSWPIQMFQLLKNSTVCLLCRRETSRGLINCHP